MTIADLFARAPQKTFLVQGSESFFEALLADAVVQDPFTHALSVPRLTIDHAYALAQFLVEGTGEARVHLVYFDIFSPDAAQVLLKSLEEPDLDTMVVLVTPHPYLVPQTIRSRMMLIGGDIQTAVSMFPQTRDEALALIKNEFGSDAEDDAATKRARAAQFLDELETRVRTTPARAQAIYEAKHMLYKANIPTKYVLEYAVTMAM